MEKLCCHFECFFSYISNSNETNVFSVVFILAGSFIFFFSLVIKLFIFNLPLEQVGKVPFAGSLSLFSISIFGLLILSFTGKYHGATVFLALW